ncbi:hypothetical protein J5N97_025765 [Dioscorea zingiberensis]|uniref:Uncharacterized protein n=1 Tax=Dioscorea zingiberensis TaxID=325984 RepID=A0A9D5C0W2_9LILI|nr:hypothetical protein J5N97_025765 [Dioscorea zingiberensis]
MGNSVLGRFGMSVDNFKAVKDPNTGSEISPAITGGGRETQATSGSLLLLFLEATLLAQPPRTSWLSELWPGFSDALNNGLVILSVPSVKPSGAATDGGGGRVEAGERGVELEGCRKFNWLTDDPSYWVRASVPQARLSGDIGGESDGGISAASVRVEVGGMRRRGSSGKTSIEGKVTKGRSVVKSQTGVPRAWYLRDWGSTRSCLRV